MFTNRSTVSASETTVCLHPRKKYMWQYTLWYSQICCHVSLHLESLIGRFFERGFFCPTASGYRTIPGTNVNMTPRTADQSISCPNRWVYFEIIALALPLLGGLLIEEARFQIIQTDTSRSELLFNRRTNVNTIHRPRCYLSKPVIISGRENTLVLWLVTSPVELLL